MSSDTDRPDGPPGDGPVVTTEYGAVRGLRSEHGAVFKGVPYAAAPVGELRFRPPQAPPPWAGVRDAVEWGPVSAQVADPLERYPSGTEVLDSTAAGMEVPVYLSEDSLTLNVWTPGPDGPPRPVMVFIHGGAFVVGTSSSDYYTGEHLARHDVVVVTFNYRLGVFGFLELGGLGETYRGSGNNGLRDQVAALEWVRRNIAAFGGDPSRVTVFGESAGSISISALLATRDPARLFDQVIAQSGGPNLVHTAAFQDLAADAVFEAAREVGIDDVLTASTSQLVEAGFVASLRSPFADTLFAPYIDGDLVLGDAYDRVRDGAAAGIPMMAGATQDEMGYWSMYDSQLRNYFVEETDFGSPVGFPDTVRSQLDDELGPGAFDEVYATWVAEHDPPRGQRDDATTVLLTQAHDYIMIQPMTRLAEAQVDHAPTWLYRFNWKVPSGLLESPEQDLGAIHALELPFVFGTFDISAPCGQRVVEDPDQFAHAEELSRSMLSAWTNFARTGDPNGDGVPPWPQYDLDQRATIVWANDDDGRITSGTVSDPDGTRRRALATFGFPPFG